MFRSCLACAVLTCTAAVTSAQTMQPIRILTLDASRCLDCNGKTFSLAANSIYPFAYSELFNPANFGTGGVVKRAVIVTAVPVISGAALSNADVVVLPTTKDRKGLTSSETLWINSFLCKGGGVVAMTNWGPQNYAGLVGAVPGGFENGGPNTGVITSSPIAKGVFGTLKPGTKFETGWSGSFASLGRAGGTAVATKGKGTLGAYFALGPGKLVVWGDEEMFAFGGTCGSNGWSVTTRALWLNSIVGVTPAPGFAFKTQDKLFDSYGTACTGAKNIEPKMIWTGTPKSGGYIRMLVSEGPANGVGVILFGAQRAQLRVFDCDILVQVALLFNWVLTPAGGAVLEFATPVGIKGQLVGQGAFLDFGVARGFSTTKGAEVAIR